MILNRISAQAKKSRASRAQESCAWGLAFLVCVLAGCQTGQTPDRSGANLSADTGDITFVEITAEAGLGGFKHTSGATGEKWFPETMGSGAGFIDYNGDGWLDIVLVGGGAWTSAEDEAVTKLWLYQNQKDNTFVLDSSNDALSKLPGYGLGVAAADYDNDGDQDLFYTTLGTNHLLRNDNGMFVKAAGSGVGNEQKWSTAAVFFDADRDGWLDLYVGNYVDWSPEDDLFCSTDGKDKGYCTPELYGGTPGRFYHNEGNGTFVEQTEGAGFVTSRGKTLGAVDLDFNGDGWPDLAVANDTDPDFLYKNNGDGTFTEIGLVSGMAFDERGRARAGMGIDAAVTDDSGQESIFVGNFSNQTIGVYRHIGNDVFVDRAATSKIGQPSLLTLTFGLFLFDVDLDGDLDLFAANGHVQPSIESVTDNIKFRQASHLFENLGDGSFVDVVQKAGGPLAQPIVGRGAAYGDVDNDGDIDILVVENDGPAHLFRNDTADEQTSLRVNLRGITSNRDGVDATVTVVGGPRRIVRRVRTGGSFLSNSEKTLTFGTTGLDKVDSLIIAWPSGRINAYTNLAVQETLNLTEADDFQQGATVLDRATRSH